MNMMRHCRQCRADAVGLLGEDRGQEFTMDKIEDPGNRLRGRDGEAGRSSCPDRQGSN
jgi:MoaA/NifB/PqqE/SkfB family radical SAM enzyme